jgi:dTDP-4-dehydrorhamnose reductase
MTDQNVTVLLTGAAGLLGTWLRRTAPTAFSVVPATHRRRVSANDVVADLRDRDAAASALAMVRPGVVIHAGYARDHASIVDATTNLVDTADEVNADLIFVSSDAVFSGDGAPRSESARPDPVWEYGRWKAEAERVAAVRDPTAAIVRLPLIISVDPEDHIVADIRRGQESGIPTIWFSDEMRQPAYAEELSRAIWDIASIPPEARSGVWHLPGAERLSRYEIADRAVAALELDRSSIVSAPTPPEAQRPRDLNLTGERARAQIGWRPSPIHPSPDPRHEASSSQE